MGRRPRRSLSLPAATKGKENQEKLEFLSLNSMVEVSSNEEGLKGAWYVAKILKLKHRQRKGKFLVQYENLVYDDDPNDLLTETVDSSFIRPLPPPPAPGQTYQMGDIVDAFIHDGWWKGVVSKVEILKEEETTSIKYTIVFESPPEKFDFCSENLRFHWDWTDGKWVQPPKQKEIPNITLSEEQSANADNVEEHPEVVAPVTGSTVAKHHNGEKCYKRMRDITAWSKENSIAKKAKDNPLNIQKESEQQNVSKVSASGIESEDFASKETEISFRNENTENADNVVKHPEVVAPVPGSTVGKNHNKEKSYYQRMRHGAAQSKEKSSVNKSKKNPMDIQKESEQPNISKGTASEMKSKDCASKEAEVSCRNENVDLDNAAKYPKVAAAVTGATKYHNGEISSFKRMHDGTAYSRDKSSVKKSILDSQKESNAFGHKDIGEQQNVPKETTSEMETEDCTSNEAEISCRTENSDTDNVAKHPKTVASATASSATKYHNGEKSSCKIMCDELSDSNDQSSVTKSKNNPLDLQKESEQKYASKGDAIDMESKDSAITEAEISCTMENAGGDGHVENCNQSPAVTSPADSEPLKEGEMPFMKTLPLWKHVDSLDVFRYMPQNPHFKPLLECSEALREGFAIGYMLNFSSLVEKTSNMRADEPREVFENNLEALADLESYGFDVKAVIDRTKELLTIKTRQEQLNIELENVQIKITQCNSAKGKVKEEIRDIDKKLCELEKKLAIKLLEKVVKDSESDRLRRDANTIPEDVSNSELDFESLATAPW